MVAVLQPTGKGKLIAIDRAVVLVGRSADCDAVITHSQKISRKHCCLVQADDQYYVRDLGSMNGVWLNGTKVAQQSRLSLGDKLSIGDVEFLFHPNARIEPRKQVLPTAGAAAPKTDAGSRRPIMFSDQSRKAEPGRTPVIDEEIVEVLDDEIIDLDDDSVIELHDNDIVMSVEELDAIDDVEIVDDAEFVGRVEVVDDIEVLDDIEMLDDGSSEEVQIVEVIDDIEVLDDDDLEILEEVEVIRPGRPLRRRSAPSTFLDDDVAVDDEDLLIFDDED